jgi:uncharacterized protein (TIGR00106 family)
MLVEFAIIPVDGVHMGRDIAKVVQILQSAGLAFRVGPMSTCLEGEWDAVFDAIRRCEEVISQTHERVITTITVDHRKHFHHSLADAVESVSQWHR